MSFDLVQTHYDSLAEKYDDRWNHFLEPYENTVSERLKNLRAPDRLIDLGCGTGRMLKQIQGILPETELFGLDGSPAMLREAHKKIPNLKSEQVNLDDFQPNNDTKYDCILSLSIFQFLRDPQHHFELIRSLSHKESTIFFCTYAIDTYRLKIAEYFWRKTKAEHYKAYSSKELHKMISNHGFFINHKEILKPNNFWRVQLYQLSL